MVTRRCLEIHFQVAWLLNEFGLRGNGDECEASAQGRIERLHTPVRRIHGTDDVEVAGHNEFLSGIG